MQGISELSLTFKELLHRLRAADVNYEEEIGDKIFGGIAGFFLFVSYAIWFLLKATFFISIMFFLIFSGFYMYHQARVQEAQIKFETVQVNFAVASYNASLFHTSPYVTKVMRAENKIRLAEKDLKNAF